ncbi:MAG: uncharacterized protein A8A55_2968 [Amphiamblys sp. WSBS2006]|nr:MAG: uncharacterized protein A8A55_2968 [Amphiamblys sp. WSBS2006]
MPSPDLGPSRCRTADQDEVVQLCPGDSAVAVAVACLRAPFLLDHLRRYSPFAELSPQCRRCQVPVPSEKDFLPAETIRAILLPRTSNVSVSLPIGMYTVPTVRGPVGVETSPRSTESDALLISLMESPSLTAIAISCLPGPSPAG